MAEFILSAFSDEAGIDLDEQIRACQANGITHMELRGLPQGNVSSLTTDDAWVLKAKLDAEGMQVSAIGSPYGKMNIADDFESHFAAFQNTVEVAKILGCHLIRMFSFYFDEGQSYEAYRDEVFSRVGRMADYALAHNVLCCHENEKGIYGDTAERCLDLYQHFEGRLAGVFDPANFIQCGVHPLEAYEMLEPYILYMHVKDAKMADGSVTPAGAGDGQVGEILRRFQKMDGKRFLSLEPHLKVFAGLSALEKDDETAQKMEQYAYPTNRAAFDAAAQAMHRLLSGLNA